MFGSWVLNEIWIIDISLALVGKLMSSFKLALFRTKLISTQVCCPLLTICAKLTMVFTFTSLPFKFYTSVSGSCCGFGFEQNYWRIDGFGEKKEVDRWIYIPLFTPSLIELSDNKAGSINEVLDAAILDIHWKLNR